MNIVYALIIVLILFLLFGGGFGFHSGYWGGTAGYWGPYGYGMGLGGVLLVILIIWILI